MYLLYVTQHVLQEKSLRYCQLAQIEQSVTGGVIAV